MTIIRRATCLLVRLGAGLLVLQVLIALAGPPHGLVDWLVAADLRPTVAPRYIVVLGGGGIPSKTGLIRTYCAAQYGGAFSNTTFIVSLPADESPETSSVGRMRDELVLRGIPAAAVRMEFHARNTHEQAVNIRDMLGPAATTEPLVLVTSDYHLRRAILCFRQVGFVNVRGVYADEVGAEADPGGHAWSRYRVWHHLEREPTILRELLALLMYKVRGWI